MDIIRRFKKLGVVRPTCSAGFEHNTDATPAMKAWVEFSDYVAIQLNDTHPASTSAFLGAAAIPQLTSVRALQWRSVS